VALSQRRSAESSEDRLRTLGSSYFALLLQEPGSALPEASAKSVVELIADSSPVAKAVLVILALFSVVSWAVILYKWMAFSRAKRQSESFLDVFRRSNKFSEVQAVCKSLGASPLVGMFLAGYAELTAQLRQGAPAGPAAPLASSNPGSAVGRPTLKSLTAVDRSLMRASAVEVNKLEKYIPLLATTASVAPFIGLFGTVWGIMAAFLGISSGGSSNLDQVGPGIAEALVATAFGLAAAIPAVMGYNSLSNRVKLFASEMDDFAMEFLNISERNFT
jgi:biopolymer transport protein TolQ